MTKTQWIHYGPCDDPRDGCGAPAGRPCIDNTSPFVESRGAEMLTPHDHRPFAAPDDTGEDR